MSGASPLQPELNPYSPPTSTEETRLGWTSEPVVESLRQTRPWVLLFSILGFIVAAIILLAGLIQAAMSFAEPSPRKAGEAVGAGMFTLMLGLLYFFPSLYLLRFAGHIRDLTHGHRLADLEAALTAQRSFWRFCGIAVTCVLALYALIIVGAMGLDILQAVGR